MQRLNSTPALRLALLFLSVVLAAGADVFGQEQGRISGVVRNAAGAKCPGSNHSLHQPGYQRIPQRSNWS